MSEAAGGAAHLELSVQARRPSMPCGQQLVHVPVQLSRHHLSLSGQDGFHQDIVDKNVLLLHTGDKELSRSVGSTENYI